MFRQKMKHLEVPLKYSAARRIFDSLLGVSSDDETLRLVLDIIITSKIVYKRKRGQTPGWILPMLNFVEYPLGICN